MSKYTVYPATEVKNDKLPGLLRYRRFKCGAHSGRMSAPLFAPKCSVNKAGVPA